VGALTLSYLHAMAVVGACRLPDTEEEISGRMCMKSCQVTTNEALLQDYDDIEV